MIDALIGGKIVSAAVERTASSGKTFVTCKVRAADSDGESQYVNLVAFDEGVKCALLALDDGDGVSVSGAMKVGTYEARDGVARISINVIAHAVLTLYHVKRKRDALAQASNVTSGGEGRGFATGKRNGTRVLDGNSSSTSMPDDDLDL